MRYHAAHSTSPACPTRTTCACTFTWCMSLRRDLEPEDIDEVKEFKRIFIIVRESELNVVRLLGRLSGTRHYRSRLIPGSNLNENGIKERKNPRAPCNRPPRKWRRSFAYRLNGCRRIRTTTTRCIERYGVSEGAQHAQHANDM